MLGSRISDEAVMRYADGALPWYLRIPIAAALVLSPLLRQRVLRWRRFSATVRELSSGSATSSRMCEGSSVADDGPGGPSPAR